MLLLYTEGDTVPYVFIWFSEGLNRYTYSNIRLYTENKRNKSISLNKLHKFTGVREGQWTIYLKFLTRSIQIFSDQKNLSMPI